MGSLVWCAELGIGEWPRLCFRKTCVGKMCEFCEVCYNGSSEDIQSYTVISNVDSNAYRYSVYFCVRRSCIMRVVVEALSVDH